MNNYNQDINQKQIKVGMGKRLYLALNNNTKIIKNEILFKY